MFYNLTVDYYNSLLLMQQLWFDVWAFRILLTFNFTTKSPKILDNV